MTCFRIDKVHETTKWVLGFIKECFDLTTFNAIVDFVSHQTQIVVVGDVNCLCVAVRLSRLIFHPSFTAVDC